MLTESQREQLVQGASVWGLAIDDEVVRRLDRFADLLEQANRQLNLTRVRPEDVVTLHFLDSLALAAVMRPQSGARLIDVGTGAGFPGLPLALVFQEISVTLLDGTAKRLNFIDNVIAHLNLSNVRTLHGRAEEIARQPQHRGAYDLATARAVAKLPKLAAWLLPFVRPGGHAVAYKGRDVDAEIDDARLVIQQLGGSLQRVAEVTLPNTDITRKLVVLGRVSGARTPARGRPRGETK